MPNQLKGKRVTDGTSKSIYALEIRRTWRLDMETFPMWFLNCPQSNIVYQDCDYVDPASPWFMGPITLPELGLNFPTFPPDPSTGFTGSSEWPMTVSAGSSHPATVNAVLLDGSVQGLSENISQDVLRAYGSIGQSDIIKQ